MADVEDWEYYADIQEKSLSSLQNLSICAPISLPVPAPGNNASPEETKNPEKEETELDAAELSLMKKLVRSHLINVTMSRFNNVGRFQQKSPNSPLYSVKSFEELNLRPELLKGVYSMGFNSPSKIQETALTTLIADPPQNMIAQSQTGTGKTAAFTLASLSRVDPSLKYPHVLVLSPTYELAMQTGKVAQQMAKFCPNIKFRYAVMGEHLDKGTKIQEHFLIGTPGKVFDWAIRYKFFDLRKIKVFVLDDADVLIATQGYQDQSIRIHKQLPKDCQMMLFSATYSSEVIDFAELIVPDPIIIRLRREEESLDNIKQYYIVCETKDEKYEALSIIYGNISIGQAFIFCHTKKTAGWLAEKMSKDGHSVALLSKELSVEQRIAVLTRFQKGQEKVLITTNDCAHGIDVEQVTVVINFDLPINQSNEADCETYLKCIGRTGRFGKFGLAINMVDGRNSMAVLRQIEDHFKRKIKKVDAHEIDNLEEMGKR